MITDPEPPESPGREVLQRSLVPLLVAFVLTRVLLGVAAVTSSGIYERVGTDTYLYERYAVELVDADRTPYGEVTIEYPPVLLPFLEAPRLIAPGLAYGPVWVALMVAVDAAGFAAVVRLSRRWGGAAGAWWWVALFPLLGPLVYCRFDLIPAVAAVWALERAAAGGWGQTGGWLALGALAKVWPGFLVPATLVAARRPWRVVAGGAAVTVTVLLPLAPVWRELAHDVIGYHLARGIQVESLWANGLLLAGKAGYPVEVVRNFGAAHLASGVSPLLKTLSTVLSLTAVAASVAWARRRLGPDDVRGLAALAFTLTAALVVTGSVLSPQFLIWLAALAALSQADPDSPLRTSVRWCAAAALANHALFPTFYRPLVRRFAWESIAVLSVRNLLLIVVVVSAVTALARRGPQLPAPGRPRQPVLVWQPEA